MFLNRVRLAAALLLSSLPLASAAGFSEASFAQVGAQGGAGVREPVRF